MKFEIIVAMDNNGVIGTMHQPIPWKQRLDQFRFRDMTLGNLTVYGSNTLATIPFKHGFPDRGNFVISSKVLPVPSYCGKLSLQEFIDACKEQARVQAWVKKDSDVVYIVGGGDVYWQALDAGIVSKVHLTRVNTEVDQCATTVRFPTDMLEANFSCVATEHHLGDGVDNEHNFTYKTYVRNNA